MNTYMCIHMCIYMYIYACPLSYLYAFYSHFLAPLKILVFWLHVFSLSTRPFSFSCNSKFNHELYYIHSPQIKSNQIKSNQLKSFARRSLEVSPITVIVLFVTVLVVVLSSILSL